MLKYYGNFILHWKVLLVFATFMTSPLVFLAHHLNQSICHLATNFCD